MRIEVASFTFNPVDSALFWSKDCLEASIQRQNYRTGFPMSYISGALAFANVLTLPVTLLLDPIIGIAESILNCCNINQVRVRQNFIAKVFESPIRHMKVAVLALGVQALAIPMFYAFAITSAFFFNGCIQAPLIGFPLACFVVTWWVNFPLGWYAILIQKAMSV